MPFSLLYRSKQLIKDAIFDNDFLKNLDSNQMREIVDCMYEKQVLKNQYIIKEGEAGQYLYVSAGTGNDNKGRPPYSHYTHFNRISQALKSSSCDIIFL